jgi:hypothetical protein
MNLVKAIVKLVLKKAFNKQSAFGRLDLDIREKFRFSCRFSFLGKSLLDVVGAKGGSAAIADGASKLIPARRDPCGWS